MADEQRQRKAEADPLPAAKDDNSSGVEAFDHYVCGFDEGGYGLAFFEGEFAGGVGGDDAGDFLIVYGEVYLGEEALDADAGDFADDLVAAGDAAVALAGFGLGLQLVLC